jgi:hypothetical protein
MTPVAFLDSIVNASFRTEAAGRVVVFSGVRRHRGYLVKSRADELKIRSFLKMFFLAHASILVLGLLLASGWSHDLAYALGPPAMHVARTTAIFLGIYSVVVGVPYFLLWRSYKTSLATFVSPEDEVLLSSGPTKRPYALLVVALFILGLATLLAVAVKP